MGSLSIAGFDFDKAHRARVGFAGGSHAVSVLERNNGLSGLLAVVETRCWSSVGAIYQAVNRQIVAWSSLSIQSGGCRV
jgi:hypothetical protein